MALPFNELLKQARAASQYPHKRDFANAVGKSFGGYLKWEAGSRLPSQEDLGWVLKTGFFPPETSRQLLEAWRKAKANQAGIPTPAGDVDVAAVLSQMSQELQLLLRKHIPEELSGGCATVVRTFKKRAEIILRTALET
jgi:transcriptional regulator with XRE-family HTH domain